MPPKPKLRFAEIIKAMQNAEASKPAKEEEEQKRDWQRELDKEDMFLYVFIGLFLLLIGLLYFFGSNLDSVKIP